ncbi:diguanylate cyclase (GGDEF)-like protein [Kineococcus xinjiangensis]|uniref:Diguanylate cyclase (GGDEF)-like protein n=1 Tax=Kineococcus xinjiangensis TaxID=512762 RepID=A0A2S6IEN0_9ACTN|nr:diguanylate cyclase (GGDEF)-like protein [Kineococcus xinjiangensis]
MRVVHGPAPGLSRAVAADLAEVPWSGFTEAADAVLAHLQERFGMDLWVVTRVREGSQEVHVARSGAFRIPQGTPLPWLDSLSRQIHAGSAPRVATDARIEMAFGAPGVDRRFRVGAYLGVPLLTEEGHLRGTLCAFSGNRQPDELALELPVVELFARLLSTLLAKEEFAHERSEVAAAAYAMANRDPLTGVLNRRGWERALDAEEQRCLRGGRCSAVAVVDLDGLSQINDSLGHEAGDELLVRAARALESAVRPCDQVARVEGDVFGLIAADAGGEGVRAWAARLGCALRAAGVQASIGAAASSPDRPLSDAWHAADAAMRADKQSRRGPRRRAG